MESMQWIDEELKDICDRKLFRTLTELQSGQTPEVVIQGRRYLLFASNSYLGLSVDPRVISAARIALEKYGTGSGGSRLVSGSSDMHRELEEKIAGFKNTEAAILFSSGYLANVGTISVLVGQGDFVYSDQLNHASIIDGCRLSKANLRVYSHLDFEELKTFLIKDSKSKSKKLVVTDTVFSMDGDLVDLKELSAICERYGAMLMVDEAHASGVLGERGSGATEHFNVEDKVPVVMGTLSKAIGSLGGYVAGSKNLVDFIRNRVRSYIFDTSLPPASLAASMKAIDIIIKEKSRRDHLWKMIHRFKSGIEKIGLKTISSNSAIIPILTGEPEPTLRFADELRKEGIFTPAVRPPSVPPGKCRIRTSIMAVHNEDHIDLAVKAFKTVSERVRII